MPGTQIPALPPTTFFHCKKPHATIMLGICYTARILLKIQMQALQETGFRYD